MPKLIPSQQRRVDAGELVRVIACKDATIRGTTYFQETLLLFSPEFAQHLVNEKLAYYPLGGLHLSDPNSYKGGDR